MKKPIDTKTKLLDTAIRLIWQSSYGSVGVAEICKQAGVTKGSFYHHFESKADLFYAASQHYWDNIKAEFDKAYSPSYEPLEQLENLIQMIFNKQHNEQYVREDEDNPVPDCPFFTSGSQVGSGGDKVRLASMEMAERTIKYNTALVRSLKGEGLLEGDPQPQQIGRMIHHYIQGLIIFGRVHRSMEVIREDLREALYRIIGLKPEYRTYPEHETTGTATT